MKNTRQPARLATWFIASIEGRIIATLIRGVADVEVAEDFAPVVSRKAAGAF